MKDEDSGSDSDGTVGLDLGAVGLDGEKKHKKKKKKKHKHSHLEEATAPYDPTQMAVAPMSYVDPSVVAAAGLPPNHVMTA